MQPDFFRHPHRHKQAHWSFIWNSSPRRTVGGTRFFQGLESPPPTGTLGSRDQYQNMSISRFITPFRLRLFPRFLIVLMVLTVVPVALVGFIVVGINNDSLQFEVQRFHSKTAELLAKRFDSRLATLDTQLNLVRS